MRLNYFLFLQRIRRAGYPIRHSFEAFVDRYHMLVRGLDGSMRSKAKEACHVILSHALKGEDWQLGHTKVFLKVGFNDNALYMFF